MNIVALIPARSGSQRIPGKNVKLLGGVPLMAWTIAAAKESGLFEHIYVSTDSVEYMQIAAKWGARAFMRACNASATQADIVWVTEIMGSLAEDGIRPDKFAILRPTSPFRTAETIERCDLELEMTEADSIRAVEKCKQHPAKMWVVNGDRMSPLLPQWTKTPWHSQPYAALPPVYAQNASLEIAFTEVLWNTKTISGNNVAPFFTKGLEGFNIDYPEDWFLAEAIVASGKVKCPTLA